VSDEVKRTGACARTVAELAARAGVCLSTTRNAIRTASRLGLLTVEERRQHCARNLPNIIRLVSSEWLTWLSKEGRFKNLNPTGKEVLNREKRGGFNNPQKTLRGGTGGLNDGLTANSESYGDHPGGRPVSGRRSSPWLRS